MKNSKRILSVKIKRMFDDSPDTSYLGEYSNRPKSEYAIDRKHSLTCPVNTPASGSLWISTGTGRIELRMTLEQAESISHSGECDEDVKELSQIPEIKSQLEKLDKDVLASELKEYGAWDAEELRDHSQNLQRILWILGCNLAENHGCDCGEHGDAGRNEYRYFNGPIENYKGESPEDIRKYVRRGYERMESLNDGQWCYIGIRADAEVLVPMGEKPHGVIQTITSGGLWGIESDSDSAYLDSIGKEELADLRGQLKALGFSTRAISAAFKNVEEVNE